MYSFDEVLNYDPDLAKAMDDELGRQRSHIELIASENLVSKAVMAAMGSPLTNKYAEGYPGKRYYGGCEYVDVVETLAIERAKKLFGCEYANVQPHSGAQANLAVFFALVNPGDTVMGMSLDCGGHLSHGSPVNISGKYFNIVPYGVTADGFIDYDEVLNYDPDLAKAMDDELGRQRSHIELIASENLVSKAVMAAMGSPLTNKYAEGYPGKRYYGGCEYVDVVETLAIERAKKLFGCEYANVQPHSGAQANLAVFFALVNPGDTVMGMSLDCGGHLSHGSPVNISGKYFNIVPYGVTADGFIDYDEVLRIAKECKPKMIIAGASAYARTIDFKKFREICDEVGALLMVDMAHIAGLVAGGAHPSPIPYADVTTTTTHKTLRGPRGGMILASAEAAEKFKLNKSVFPGIQGGPLMHVIAGKAVCLKEALDPSFKVYAENVVKNASALANGLMNRGFDIVSGGTDNHLMLVNLLSKGKTGKEVEKLLDAANITCNKNTIPNDPASPFVTSGIRLGTAAVTTRGFNEADMDVVAEAIAMLVDDVDANQAKAMELVKGLTDKYPLYE